MKSRTGLIVGLLAAVLIFILTLSQIIEPGTVVLRILIVFALGYLLGIGLDIFYRSFIKKAVEQNDPANRIAENAVDNISRSDESAPEPGAVKGGRVDFKVGSLDDLSEPVAEVEEPGQSPGSSKPHMFLEKRFEVNDKFVLIDDKKIPNDPAMMASAIKTKMED